MYVFTTFINIIFTYYLYKQGRAGPWQPIQSLPARQFRFFGLGRGSLIVSQTTQHVAYPYKFVICYMPCYICQELSSFIIFMNSCICYI